MDSSGFNIRDFSKMSFNGVMDTFVDLFKSYKMLDQTVKVEHRNREYKIFCNEDKFFAYRINQHPGISPGIPGWTTCIATRDQIIDSKSTGNFDNGESSVHEWLTAIANGDIKRIEDIE